MSPVFDTETVFTRDRSSGRVHRRYQAPSGRLASLEEDNLDDAGEYDRISEAEANATERGLRCRNCFPDDDPAISPI
jgi:hypothetical protein